MLLLTIALITHATSNKMVLFDDDVGTCIVMPNTQISVDMVVVPQGLVQLYSGWQIIDFNKYYLTTCFVSKDQKIFRNCNELNLKQSNSVEPLSTGDVAVNLGLKSTSKTTSNSLNYTLICTDPSNQRGYRLDIGERVSRLRNNQTYII